MYQLHHIQFILYYKSVVGQSHVVQSWIIIFMGLFLLKNHFNHKINET